MDVSEYVKDLPNVSLEERRGFFAVENPATTETIAYVRDQGRDDAEKVVAKAVEQQADWAATAPRARADILMRTRELMLRDADELAALMSAENGKSQADASAEVVYAAEFFRWYGEESIRPGGDFGVAPAGGTRTLVTSRPVGVAALVTPWNFPAAMATRKIAPALAAGCAALLKPAHETPLTALAVTRLLREAGLPDGLVAPVVGEDAGAIVSTWMEDRRVRKISFTGSTGVGRLLLHQAADRIMNSSMELGGAAPFIVTASANIDDAVDGAMIAKFRNAGQACTAANCIFVHRSKVDEFVQKFGARVEDLRVGYAVDGADVGPLITAAAREKVAGRVEKALSEGARIAHQGQTPDLPGHFHAPTVLLDVTMESELVWTETFGPVAPIVVFDSVDDLLRDLAGLEYGLSAYVYAETGEGLRLAEKLDCGMVGVNRGIISDPAAPFGGTKQSGIGREGARLGLEEFLEPKYFSIAW